MQQKNKNSVDFKSSANKKHSNLFVVSVNSFCVGWKCVCARAYVGRDIWFDVVGWTSRAAKIGYQLCIVCRNIICRDIESIEEIHMCVGYAKAKFL